MVTKSEIIQYLVYVAAIIAALATFLTAIAGIMPAQYAATFIIIIAILTKVPDFIEEVITALQSISAKNEEQLKQLKAE